jgi:hypothetical protein
MTPSSCMTEPATKPGLLELALTFNKISLASFGGGLSSGRCKTSIKSFGWGCKSQSLAWSFVERPSHFVTRACTACSPIDANPVPNMMSHGFAPSHRRPWESPPRRRELKRQRRWPAACNV